jgi:predicted HicB family RNase H-like nuclease
MSAIRYKDFQGSVEFEDNLLIIRILHIDDLVTTEIDSAAKAQEAFEELVDDYLVTCAELGKEPCRPFKGSFNVRVSPELHRQVAMAAADVDESMNSWISAALVSHLDRQKTRKAMLNPSFFERLVCDQSMNRQYLPIIEMTGKFQSHADWGVAHRLRVKIPAVLERQRVN